MLTIFFSLSLNVFLFYHMLSSFFHMLLLHINCFSTWYVQLRLEKKKILFKFYKKIDSHKILSSHKIIKVTS